MSNSPGRLGRVAAGAAAGAVASVAMGGVFLGARGLGIVSKVAPEHVTETALDVLDGDPPEPAENLASALSHIAFGAVNGALFNLVRPVLPIDSTTAGILFAGAVMVASYEGWVPASGALPPLHEQSRGGKWTLVVGHLTYGVVLGLLTRPTNRR
jgi:hypothetical protein